MLSYQRDHYVNTADLHFPYIDDIGGTIRGYRIFTACRTVNGKLFRLEDHLNRLYYSASTIHMTPPLQREELKVILAEVVAKNLQSDYDGDLLVDVIFSGGLDGSSMKQSGKGAHLYIAVQKLIPPPPEAYRDGVTLATFKHQRLCPDVKLLNYIGAILAHQTVVPEHDAFEVLFVDPADDDSILEGSTFTIFFIDKNGLIKTPPLDGKILDSVTRRVLLELLNKNGITCQETKISIRELDLFAECFLASTTRNVLPVVRIDEQVVGTGTPGPQTSKIMGLIEEYVRSY